MISGVFTVSYLLLLPYYSICFSAPFRRDQKSLPSSKLHQSFTSTSVIKDIPKSSKSQAQIETISDELLSLVLNRWNSGDRTKEIDSKIDNLMNMLIESKTKFDPNISLVDTFYATIYTSGGSKEPLWKTIAEIFSNKNIQGQKYVSGNKENEGYVVNYSEILGKDIRLCAYGTYEKNDNAIDSSNTSSDNNNNNPFMKFFQPKKDTSSSQIDCPVDYTAKVNEAAILYGKQKLSIPISGAGTVRVLYADPQLRIFISPNDNTDSRWEKAGLKVTQVKIDLIDDNLKYWDDLATPNMP